MNERKVNRKYLVWAAIAMGCVLFDVGFFVVLGSAVKWMATLASPFVWAGLAVLAVASARLMRLLDGVQLTRPERTRV